MSTTEIYFLTLLFFCFVPFGIFGLFQAYKLGKKIFYTSVITEVSFTTRKIDFTIEKMGKYSICHKGILLTRAPVDEFYPQITNLETGEIIKLSRSILRQSRNGIGTSSVVLFNFRADKGNYRLELIDGSSIFAFEKIFSPLVSALPFNPDTYFIQIIKYQNPLLIFCLVWLVILSIASISGGLIFASTVEQLFG